MVWDVKYSEHTLITFLKNRTWKTLAVMFLTAKHSLGFHSRTMVQILRSQCSMRSSQCPLDFSYSNNPSLGSSLLGDPEDHTVVLQSQEWYLTQSERYSLLKECQKSARVLLTRDVVCHLGRNSSDQLHQGLYVYHRATDQGETRDNSVEIYT